MSDVPDVETFAFTPCFNDDRSPEGQETPSDLPSPSSLARSRSGSIQKGPDMEERRLLTTMTGEIFQPARLYYEALELDQTRTSRSRT